MKTRTATSVMSQVKQRPVVQTDGSLVGPPGSARRGFLSVYVDPQTWGAAFFILVSFVTGILYFTWAVTGLALSVSFLILIIGLPFALLFLLSVRGLAQMEARLVATSLGVDLDAASVLGKPGLKWMERLKALVADRSTWSALLYLVLQLPLGVIYFSVTITLVSLGLGLMTAPFLYVLTPGPIILNNANPLDLPAWVPVLITLLGFLVLTGGMYVIRGIGRWHAKHAKGLLAG